MNRFQKKCFVGSATLHGGLLAVFLVGSAFHKADVPKDMGPVVTLLATPTDKPFNTGGNPNGGEPPPPKPTPQQPPAPQPEPPKPVARQEPRPEPPKPEPVKVKETAKVVEKGDLPVKIAKPKETPKPVEKTLTKTTIKRTDPSLAEQQREAAERAAKEAARRRQQENARIAAERQRIADAVNGIVGGTGRSISKNTVAEPVGPGGAAFVNYSSLVAEIYKRAVYATQPQSDEDAEAVIRVVVARNGTVRSSQWVRRTNSSVLNKAVDRAMNSVRSLPEFPPESRDAERTFNITISFEAKGFSA